MAMGLQTTQVWRNRNAVIISASPSGIEPEILDRFARRQWAVHRVTWSTAEALNEIAKQAATLLVVDDHPAMPMPYALRQLMTNKFAYTVPKLVLSRQHDGKEKTCFSSLFPIEVLDKPIVPSRFIDGFERVIFQWMNSDIARMREVGENFSKGNTQSALRALTQLISAPTVTATASCCLARYLRDTGDNKTAEKVLLTAFKQSPKNVGLLVALADLYMHLGVPTNALRILMTAYNAFDKPLTLIPDIIQCYLLLNDLNATIPLLERMIADDYLPQQSAQWLLRILYSEGLEEPLKKVLKTQAISSQRLQQAWAKQEGIQKVG